MALGPSVRHPCAVDISTRDMDWLNSVLQHMTGGDRERRWRNWLQAPLVKPRTALKQQQAPTPPQHQCSCMQVLPVCKMPVLVTSQANACTARTSSSRMLVCMYACIGLFLCPCPGPTAESTTAAAAALLLLLLQVASIYCIAP